MKKVYNVILFIVLVALGTIGALYAVSMFQVQEKWEQEQFSEMNVTALKKQERRTANILAERTDEIMNTAGEIERGLVSVKPAAPETAEGLQTEESVPVSRTDEKTRTETEYDLWEYDAFTNTTRLKKQALPEEWVGLSREELCDRVSAYRKDPPLEEMEKGLTDFEVLSFSSEKVKLKKTYDQRTADCRFYGVEKDGMVVIYHMDRKTVYEYTGIRCDTLDEEEQKKLEEGIPIKDEEQLYGLLQAYSS